MKDAVAAHRSGRLEDAARLYGEVLAAEPAHADAHHLMGVLQAQAGRTEEALRFLQAAIAAAPRVPAYHVTLANALLALGRLEEAANASGRRSRSIPIFPRPICASAT